MDTQAGIPYRGGRLARSYHPYLRSPLGTFHILHRPTLCPLRWIHILVRVYPSLCVSLLDASSD